MDKVTWFSSKGEMDELITFITEEDPLDRELQSKALARIMGEAYPTPAIFLGYVVTKPLAERRLSFAISLLFASHCTHSCTIQISG